MEKQNLEPIATCPHLYSPADNEDDPEDDNEQCPQVLQKINPWGKGLPYEKSGMPDEKCA